MPLTFSLSSTSLSGRCAHALFLVILAPSVMVNISTAVLLTIQTIAKLTSVRDIKTTKKPTNPISARLNRSEPRRAAGNE